MPTVWVAREPLPQVTVRPLLHLLQIMVNGEVATPDTWREEESPRRTHGERRSRHAGHMVRGEVATLDTTVLRLHEPPQSVAFRGDILMHKLLLSISLLKIGSSLGFYKSSSLMFSMGKFINIRKQIR